jgi:hypothetical protein
MAKKAKVQTATEKAKALHEKIGKMLQEYHDLGDQVEAERVAALPKPVAFSVGSLVKQRPELVPFRAQLEHLLAFLENTGVKFNKVDRVDGFIEGKIKDYKVQGTFEIDKELFAPKDVVAFKLHNVADSNPLDQAWGAFVFDDSYTIYENNLLDYIVGQAKKEGV